MTTNPIPQAPLFTHLATWILKDHPLSHPGPCLAHLYPPTYLHPLLLDVVLLVMLGSVCKPVSKVGPNLNLISDKSMQPWIQVFSVSQPVKCKMPSCVFCCRQKRCWVWIIRVAFVLASGPHQCCLTVGLGGCKNSSLNCWIFPGLLDEGFML